MLWNLVALKFKIYTIVQDDLSDNDGFSEMGRLGLHVYVCGNARLASEMSCWTNRLFVADGMLYYQTRL